MASCEKIIEDEIGKMDGVESVEVCLNKGWGNIKSNKNIKFSEIKDKVEKLGYGVSEEIPQKDEFDWMTWVKAGAIVLFLFLGYRIIQSVGWLDRFNFEASQISLGMAFFIGLVASISSCMAVVGSVVIAFGEKYEAKGNNFFNKSVKPNLLFHAGRLSSFFVLGGILGLIGGEFSISGQFFAWVTIFIALIMGWLGLNILGVLPSISVFTGKYSNRFVKRWDRLKESENKAAPFLLGAGSFFLPCGFTQTMQIFALASGSFWIAGLSLFLFALGTFPALLAVGVASSWTKNQNMVTFKKVAGIIVIIFAVYTFNSGFALSKIKDDGLSSNVKNEESIPGEQVVKMKVLYSGFSPSVIKVKQGVPVKWIIEGDQVSGCTNKIIIPSLNISQEIKKGDNIVTFTPKEKGTINFSCWMGMVRGKFIVE